MLVLLDLVLADGQVVVANEQDTIATILANCVLFDSLHAGQTDDAIVVLANLVVFDCELLPKDREDALTSGLAD